MAEFTAVVDTLGTVAAFVNHKCTIYLPPPVVGSPLILFSQIIRSNERHLVHCKETTPPYFDTVLFFYSTSFRFFTTCDFLKSALKHLLYSWRHHSSNTNVLKREVASALITCQENGTCLLLACL